MTAPLLKIEHLEVRYGDLIGVSDVSLEVPEGGVVALLGSNGGGKTTVLNAVAGLIPVRSGSISFRGEAIGGQSAFSIVRKGLALSPEGWRLFVRQSVENNLLLGATGRVPQRCSIASTESSQNWRSGAASAPAPCPAASGRCWRSVGR
jgi:branched-chain amino acid transport system ATP-binding protein